MHDLSPVTSRGAEQADAEDSEATFQKWASLWRSLILSSVGATYQPYCRFIRALNLQDLRALLDQLDDDRAKGRRQVSFFEGPASQFLVETSASTTITRQQRRSRRFDITEIAEKVGDRVTMHSTMLEELSGEIRSPALLRWIPRLQHLQSLWFWDGSAIKGVGSSLTTHCPHFRSLTLYHWLSQDADIDLADFLKDLRPNTLESLKIFSSSWVGEKVVDALNRHCRSIQSLDVGQVQTLNLLTALPELDACPKLTSLHIDNRTGELSAEVVGKLSNWLLQCSALQDVTMRSTENAALVLAPYLSAAGTRLTRLEAAHYGTVSSAIDTFHSALKHQADTLRVLLLTSDGDLCDAPTLARALASLPRLTELRVAGASDFFGTEDVLAICAAAPHLEELAVSGWSVDDRVWGALAQLRGLRRLDFNAWCRPTFDVLHRCIDGLTVPGNHGLVLSVSMADPHYPLSDDEQGALAALIDTRVGGRFEYALGRGTWVDSLYVLRSPDPRRLSVLLERWRARHKIRSIVCSLRALRDLIANFWLLGCLASWLSLTCALHIDPDAESLDSDDD